MSSDLLYVKETPWKGLGTQYTVQPENAAEIIEKAKLGWEVSSLPMMTELHDRVPNYQVVYRTDLNQILGVVNKPRPMIVQNRDMFNAFDYLIGKSVDIETASSFDGGKTVFGSFKIREQYKLLDDDIDHYFVVVNDHLKVDGKVSVLNTPVRIVCQNTLELAMSKNFYHLRVPVQAEIGVNEAVANTLLNSVGDAFLNMQKRAKEMYDRKIDRTYIDRLLDELFPYQQVDDNSIHSKANENIEILRDTFVTECLDADNLGNYRGTEYQVFNAVIDFAQHYHKKADKAYDLGYRMKKLQGVGTPTEVNLGVQYLKVAKKLTA